MSGTHQRVAALRPSPNSRKNGTPCFEYVLEGLLGKLSSGLLNPHQESKEDGMPDTRYLRTKAHDYLTLAERAGGWEAAALRALATECISDA